MSAAPTIRDIARQAGCSKSSVALALQDSSLCSPAMKARVKRVAETLGYRRNPTLIARMAYVSARGRRPTVGPSLGYLSDIDRPALLHPDCVVRDGYLGAKARAQELGCNLELLCYGDPRITLSRLHRIISSRGILGLVLAPHTTPQIELGLNWDDFAIVAVGFSIRSPRFDRVGFDHYEAVLDVCERAWEKGFRRIALAMTEDSDARVEHLARAAFLRWQSDRGSIAAPVLVIAPGELGAVHAWYRRHRPDCIIVYGDVNLLTAADVPVGSEVAVVTALLSNWQPAFGGFDIRLKDLAAMSVDMLLAKLFRNERGLPAMRQTLLIQAPWVDGPAAFVPASRPDTRRRPRRKHPSTQPTYS